MKTQQKLRTHKITPNENISFPIGTILAVDYFYESLNFSTVFGKHKKNGLDISKLLKALVSYKLTDNFSISKAHKWINRNEVLDIFNLPEFSERTLYRVLETIGKTPPIPKTHYILKEFHESSKDSGVLYSINTFFHPNFIELFDDLIRNDVEIHFILSQDLLDNMTEDYNKIFTNLINTNKFNFYLHPENLGFLSLGISKHYLMFTLLRKDGNLDNVRILGNRQKALEWGSELFNYYLKDSTPINKI